MKRLKCNVGEYGVVVNTREEFLILSLPLSKKFTKEAWMLPGGRLDVGDQPGEGLQREIHEETGLNVRIIAPIHVARWGSEKPPKYVVFFLSKIVGKHTVLLSREHIDYKWVPFSLVEKIPWHNLHSKIAVKKSRTLLAKGL